MAKTQFLYRLILCPVFCLYFKKTMLILQSPLIFPLFCPSPPLVLLLDYWPMFSTGKILFHILLCMFQFLFFSQEFIFYCFYSLRQLNKGYAIYVTKVLLTEKWKLHNNNNNFKLAFSLDIGNCHFFVYQNSKMSRTCFFVTFIAIWKERMLTVSTFLKSEILINIIFY